MAKFMVLEYSMGFFLVVLLYFVFHFFVRGVRVEYLNTTQLADIQSLIADARPEDRRCVVKTYMETRFDLSGEQPDPYNFFGSIFAGIDSQVTKKPDLTDTLDITTKDDSTVVTNKLSDEKTLKSGDSEKKRATPGAKTGENTAGAAATEKKAKSSCAPETQAEKERIKNAHPAERALEKLLDQLDQANYNIHFLTDYPLKVKSYFWLNESSLYWEIIFWTWFGIFADLFLNVSEALSKKEFREEEEFVQFSKFIYGPPCSLIIYFALDKLIQNGDLAFDSIHYGTIVLSFLLGFYSRKSIELIDKVKNFIFPSKSPEAEDKSIFVPDLTEKLMQEAIAARIEQWKQQFPYILDVRSTSKSSEDGKRTEFVLTVDASEKDKEAAKQFPNFLFHVTAGNKIVKIPTELNFINEDSAAAAPSSETLG